MLIYSLYTFARRAMMAKDKVVASQYTRIFAISKKGCRRFEL